jgi:hypothetical protein
VTVFLLPLFEALGFFSLDFPTSGALIFLDDRLTSFALTADVFDSLVSFSPCLFDDLGSFEVRFLEDRLRSPELFVRFLDDLLKASCPSLDRLLTSLLEDRLNSSGRRNDFDLLSPFVDSSGLRKDFDRLKSFVTC